jgi:Kef-type K+ transport system membrane component KefB
MEENSDKFKKSGKAAIATVVILAIVCGLLFAADFIFLSEQFDKHAYFEWENWPGFYAIIGFAACVILALFSRFILRPIVKREEDFYE